jgi:hypothetical protein
VNFLKKYIKKVLNRGFCFKKLNKKEADFLWQEYLNIMDLKLNQKDLQAWGINMAINKFLNYKESLENT